MSFPPTPRPLPAVLYFLEGEAALRLGDQSMEAHAGSLVRMDPRLTHGIVAKTPVKMLLLLIKNG